ncbi:hypothetical protein JB92DRAFT_775793 [Gautieria morchelliformis]|nr:hypothetical protein JB92DRAFT_775793 [Gautieria morchelliformis]
MPSSATISLSSCLACMLLRFPVKEGDDQNYQDANLDGMTGDEGIDGYGREEVPVSSDSPLPMAAPTSPSAAVPSSPPARWLVVEDIERAVDATDGGRISHTVSCSPAAYPHHAPAALNELQHGLAHLLNAALHPANLTVLPAHKVWLLSLDCVVRARCRRRALCPAPRHPCPLPCP